MRSHIVKISPALRWQRQPPNARLMIYLSKILPAMLMPSFIVLALLLGSLMFKKRWLAGLALVLWLLASNIHVANRLMTYAERGRVHQPVTTVEPADAIVVLSGMIRDVTNSDGATTPEWGDAADRFDAGVALAKLAKAPHIAFTGGRLPWSATKQTEGAVLRDRAIARGINANRIHLTSDVQNTAQEAQAIKRWLSDTVRSNGPPRVILVTSAFHMTRAQRLFERAGMVVVPYAVDFRNSAGDIAPQLWLPSGDALDKFETAWREIIGQAYDAVRYF